MIQNTSPGDLLDSGGIAETLFGADTRKNRRRVYLAAEKGALPILRIGGSLFMSRTAYQQWLSRLIGGADTSRAG
jgi:hypothetical protein